MSRERRQPLDLSRLRTAPISQRRSKVRLADLASTLPVGSSFREFVGALPHQLAGESFRSLVAAVAQAAQRGKPVLWGMGAHVVKCGLGPWVIELMRRGVLTGVAMNGGASIHDLELAFFGHTSEDVAEGLPEGSFGTAEETGQLWNEAAQGAREGLGRALGELILTRPAPHADVSVLAQGSRLGLPVTVHVTMGADTVQMHPQANGAAIGAASHYDFRLFAAQVAELGDGGVYLNVGSAVTLPEVFLKALSAARNLGHKVEGLVTANLDMIQHYRPQENVVRRPTQGLGRGYTLTGHHELLIPMLALAVLEELEVARGA